VGATWSGVSIPGEGVRVEVCGEVDLLSEGPFVEEVDALATAQDSAAILLDLAEVDFIDSSGVPALVRVRRRHGERLRLVAVSAPVQRVLDIAGLTDGFGLEDADGIDGATSEEGAGGERAAG
jgi:anti-sigma B factor antagonist